MNLIILLALLLLLVVKYLRWLSLVQQKEYRLDRILSFLKSSEGKKELVFFPSFATLTREGLKRPVITLRSLVLGTISILFLLSLFFLTIVKTSFLAWFLFLFVILYLTLPLIVIVSILPTSLVYEVYSLLLLRKAKDILQKHNPKIIGITGSYGKTSTKILISHLLSSRFSVFTPPLSHNTKYSIARSIVKNYRGQEFVILEYAAYKIGEIRELAKFFKPSVAVVTGLTPQHLGLFGSWKNLVKAKSELLEALEKDGVVFCNASDPEVVKMCKTSKQRVDYYSGKKVSLYLKDVKLNNIGKLSFSFRGKMLSTSLVGKHYLENIQAAVAVSNFFGITDKQISDLLESFKPTSSFIQVKKLRGGAILVDDSGTANQKGFEEAIKLVKELKAERKILIFGGIVDLGNRTDDIHKSLAKEAKKVFFQVIYTGEVGKNVFVSVFSDNLIYKKDQWKDIIKNSDDSTLILAEGRIPKFLEKYITTLVV